MRQNLTIGSLFSGIGGLELGLEWAGLGPVVWQCEIDPFCRSVLAKHWPSATRYDDVRAIDASAHRVDVICGGFPCQDISNAGKRAGIDGERSGLWGEFARIIGLLRPRFVVVENVSALLGRGMGRVLGDLAELGYDAQWSTLRASDVGAPHRRERVFIVANARCERGERRGELGELGGSEAAGSGEGLQRQRDRDAAGDRGAALAHGDGAASSRERDGAEVGDDVAGRREGLVGESAQPGQPGPDDGRERRGGAAAKPAGAMGDPSSSGLEERIGERRDAGAELPPPQRAGLGKCQAFMSCRRGAELVDRRFGQHRPVCRFCYVANTESVGFGGLSLAGGDRGREGEGAEADGWRSGGTGEPERQGTWSAQPGLGGDAHGVPARVDRWPSGPEEAQQEWEPPRTITGKQENRPARLRALGNAVVPQCGEVVGRVLLAMTEGSE